MVLNLQFICSTTVGVHRGGQLIVIKVFDALKHLVLIVYALLLLGSSKPFLSREIMRFSMIVDPWEGCLSWPKSVVVRGCVSI